MRRLPRGGTGHYPAVCMCTRRRLLRGSVCLAQLLTRRAGAFVMGCPVHQHVPWGPWSLWRCHRGNHTFLNGPGVSGRSHTRCCRIFSEHRRHLSPHPLCVDSLVSGCVFSDVMEQQAGRAAGRAARQNAALTRDPPSLGAMVTGARLSGRCCPSGPEPTSCCWKRWGYGAGTVTAQPCPREESPALWSWLPSAVPSSPAPQD